MRAGSRRVAAPEFLNEGEFSDETHRLARAASPSMGWYHDNGGVCARARELSCWLIRWTASAKCSFLFPVQPVVYDVLVKEASHSLTSTTLQSSAT